jgi:hypothetical protein
MYVEAQTTRGMRSIFNEDRWLRRDALNLASTLGGLM